ncbi:MAG: DUF721 domain-containing protein [Proteobacteria bacterium]|nr:DUF721 domain-containing protein [Pseudomonadota bacterium]
MAGPPRRRSRPQALGTVLDRVLGDLGLERAVVVKRIADHWDTVVGPEAAAHCWPVGLRGTVLEAEVESPVWSQQLQLATPRILTALEELLGGDAPTDLRFRLGYTRRP